MYRKAPVLIKIGLTISDIINEPLFNLNNKTQQTNYKCM